MRETLKAARKAEGMTQQQVADHLGISLRYYRHIEAGDRTGDFEIWDALEDLFSVHQRVLRKTPGVRRDTIANSDLHRAGQQEQSNTR